MGYKERRAKWSSEYTTYHDRVVDACAKLMGDEHRAFFLEQCDYFEYFAEGTDPADVAEYQWEALT